MLVPRTALRHAARLAAPLAGRDTLRPGRAPRTAGPGSPGRRAPAGGEVNLRAARSRTGRLPRLHRPPDPAQRARGLRAGTAVRADDYSAVKNLPVHRSMAEISELIYETCKAYMVQQGKLLLVLFGVHRRGDRRVLPARPGSELPKILRSSWSSASSAWAAATGWPGSASGSTPWPTRAPLSPASGARPGRSARSRSRSGMSVGMMLISVELLFMLAILLFIPADVAGPASSASPSASRWALRRSGSRAASSPRSPTSAPT